MSAAAPPIPRPSTLMRKGSENMGQPPATWEGIYDSAQELRKVKEALKDVPAVGFVASHMRPVLQSVESMLESEATQRFGLLGRMALVKCTRSKLGEDLTMPAMVLAFGVHSAILASGYVCTGSSTSDFNAGEEWPNVLPKGWVSDTGSSFSFRYRPRSMASDRLIVRGIVQGESLVLTCSDPYSSGTTATSIHLRVKDFVKTKAGEVPQLVESKEREVLSIVDERVLPAAGLSKTGPSPRTSGLGLGGMMVGAGQGAQVGVPTAVPIPGSGGLQLPTGGGRDLGGGFGGDLAPGVGGSMLFGPGNPQFDRQMHDYRVRGGAVDPRTGLPVSVPPGARFDPFGPAFVTGDPNPDHEPMPGFGGGRYL